MVSREIARHLEMVDRDIDRQRIVSLQHTVGEQADQIEALAAELGRARQQAGMNETHGRNLKHENGILRKQLAESQAREVALVEFLRDIKRASNPSLQPLIQLRRERMEQIHEAVCKILAAPSAADALAQSRDEMIRACMETIIEQCINDHGRCLTLNCDCPECCARAAIAALDGKQ